MKCSLFRMILNYKLVPRSNNQIDENFFSLYLKNLIKIILKNFWYFTENEKIRGKYLFAFLIFLKKKFGKKFIRNRCLIVGLKN